MSNLLLGVIFGGVRNVPIINNVISYAGDSFVKDNEAEISRSNPTITPSDRQTYQMAVNIYGSSSFEYTTPTVTGVTDGVINCGYGGQSSGTVWHNINALCVTEPARLQNTWLWRGGQNDANTTPGGAVGVLTTIGTYSQVVTATISSGTALSAVSPSFTTLVGAGSLAGCSVSGAGIPAGTYLTLASGTTGTLSATCTNGTGISITITGAGHLQFLSLIPHERKWIIPPYAFSQGGFNSIGGAHTQEVRKYDWRNLRKYTFNLWRYWMSASQAYPNNTFATPDAAFTASIATASMVVTATASGAVSAQMDITGAGVAAKTQTTAGAASPFTVAPSPQTVASESMVGNLDPNLTSSSTIPSSLSKSAAANQAHPNYAATPFASAAIQLLTDAAQNKAVYVLEQSIPDVPYDQAAASTLEVYFAGYVTSAVITTDDPTYPGCYTIAMKAASTDTAILTRTSANAGNIPAPLNMRITATGLDTSLATKTQVNDVRILPSAIGAASTLAVGATFPRDTVNQPLLRRWPKGVWRLNPFSANDGKLTFVCLFNPGEDSTSMSIMVSPTTNLLVQRTTLNKMIITLRDSGGTAVVSSWTTITTNYNIAGGATWFAFSVDLSGPTIVAYSGRNASDVNISPATAISTGTGLLGLTTSIPVMFCSTLGGDTSFKGGIRMLAVYQGLFLDLTNATNRRLFWNTNATPVDLGSDGTVSSVTPRIYLRGTPGDWIMGKNFGAGGDFCFNDNWLMNQGQSSDPTVWV